MSTSDQNGGAPLTRKQMRELRLTGSTPVIEEVAAAPVAPVAPVLPRAAEPVPMPPAPAPDDSVDVEASPLTRRQAREQERIRTASVPVIASVQMTEPVAAQVPATIAAGGPPAAAPVLPAREPLPEMVSEVPAFPVAENSTAPAPARTGDQDALAAMFAAPVEAAPVAQAPVEAAPVEEAPVEQIVEQAAPIQHRVEQASPIQHRVVEQPAPIQHHVEQAPAAQAAPPAEEVQAAPATPAAAPRTQVNPDFGRSVTEQPSGIPAFSGSFDDIVSDSAGSQHSAPSALIFTQGPTEASLSGPVASTGEVLVTGSYELPRGIGSQGHADGTADGKDVDVVLIDGELPPTSSPTPIAASAAVSTSKPAGEVIRPPAPEKGNRLMMTLAIVAGGLALLLGAALIIAFTTNVF